MKKILSLTVLTFALAGGSLAQSSKTADKKTTNEKSNMGRILDRKPVQFDTESNFDASGVLRRGVLTGNVKAVSLAQALKNPKDYAGKVVSVEGVIVRSCKMEGCWMELAPAKDAASVRVTFKNHAFFIPLDAAGLTAKVEGVFLVKTLSKEEVEHLIKEDGAKFDNINTDGTVSEVSFEANGVELTKK